MSFALKLTSGAYFVKPCCRTSLSLTVFRKYQFSPASTIRISALEILSQTRLILTNVSAPGGAGLRCAGIQMIKTATLMLVMIATVPHLSLLTVLRCSAIKAIRLMMILIGNVSKSSNASIDHKRHHSLASAAGSRRPMRRE